MKKYAWIIAGFSVILLRSLLSPHTDGWAGVITQNYQFIRSDPVGVIIIFGFAYILIKSLPYIYWEEIDHVPTWIRVADLRLSGSVQYVKGRTFEYKLENDGIGGQTGGMTKISRRLKLF